MTKNDYITLFNNVIRGTPVSWQKEIIPMICDYLTEIKYEKSDKIINLIVQNPQLIKITISKIVDYYCRKHNIFILTTDPKSLNKTILYYG